MIQFFKFLIQFFEATLLNPCNFPARNIYIRHFPFDLPSCFVLDYLLVALPVTFCKGWVATKFPPFFPNRLRKKRETKNPRCLRLVDLKKIGWVKSPGFHALPGACPQRRSRCATENKNQIPPSCPEVEGLTSQDDGFITTFFENILFLNFKRQ